MTLYPLKFDTIYKDKIWGGQKIKSVLGKDFGDLPNCGETWEISGVPGNISVVSNGELKGESLADLITQFGGRLVGDKVYSQSGSEFPLLVKFIDANDDLSIQVHPDDELAKERHNSLGKTEMWYIMASDPGSTLITGFNQEMDKAKYQEYFNSGRLTEILNTETADAGDMFFIPAGRVHTIGKGILLAEIQQTSDVTYRIYDFDRVDSEGNTRELHVEAALDAIDYKKYDSYKTAYEDRQNSMVNLAQCDYFKTNKLVYQRDVLRDYSELDSFVINVCMEGSYQLDCEHSIVEVKKGEAVLIPAEIDEVEYQTDEGFVVLESYVP